MAIVKHFRVKMRLAVNVNWMNKTGDDDLES